MSNENNKVDINKHEIDIDILFKQNVNDLLAIKELYRKLKKVEEKISQIKYIDSTLANKLQKDYEKLKRIIMDENAQAKLAVEIETVNEKLTNGIKTINLQLDTVNEKLNDDIETINSQLDTVNNKTKRYGNSIRNRYPKVLVKNSEYTFPAEFSLRYDELPKVYKNKDQFITDFDVSDFKNAGGKNIFVSIKNGSASNDGLSREKPCQNLQKALTLASDNDSIIIIDEKDTIIPKDYWFVNGVISKSVNIISENRVIVFAGNIPSWAKVDNYNNIYQIARSECKRVVDINEIDEPIDLIKVDSLEILENSINSYYTDNVNVFVNVKNANEKVLPLLNTYCIKHDNSKNLKLYLENLVILGGNNNIVIQGNSSYNNHELYTKNVECLFATQGDGILVQNSKRAYHQNTTCAYSSKDGFNYSTNIANSHIVDFIEVNCKAYGNGNNNINIEIANTHNGSTAHAKSCGIRINGVYYGNYGGNVIDVQEAKSINLGCITYDSLSTDESFNQGIGTQQGKAATMWIDGCISFNNFSDIYCPTGDTINVSNSMFDTIDGFGNINLSNNY